MKQLVNEIKNNIALIKTKLMDIDCVLCSSDDYDELENRVYELPTILDTSKDGYLQTFAILEIKQGGYLICGGLYEDYGTMRNYTLEDLLIDNIMCLAEMVD